MRIEGALAFQKPHAVMRDRPEPRVFFTSIIVLALRYEIPIPEFRKVAAAALALKILDVHPGLPFPRALPQIVQRD